MATAGSFPELHSFQVKFLRLARAIVSVPVLRSAHQRISVFSSHLHHIHSWMGKDVERCPSDLCDPRRQRKLRFCRADIFVAIFLRVSFITFIHIFCPKFPMRLRTGLVRLILWWFLLDGLFLSHLHLARFGEPLLNLGMNRKVLGLIFPVFAHLRIRWHPIAVGALVHDSLPSMSGRWVLGDEFTRSPVLSPRPAENVESLDLVGTVTSLNAEMNEVFASIGISAVIIENVRLPLQEM